MNRELLSFTSEAEWLKMREVDLTSTEVSALFGCSPYATVYELFHRKTGQLVVEFESNDRVRWGTRLEAAIAYGVAEDLGLLVEPMKIYARIPELRMGSSFDFKVVGLADGFTGDETYRDLYRANPSALMEVKNVDGLQFKRGWIDDGEMIEAPPHIELQVQHQMEVADAEWVIIAPLVGGNTPRPFYRQRNREYGQMIREKVAEFWAMVDSGKAPAPDYSVDGGTIAALLANDNGQTIDMSDNNRLAEVVAEHAKASADYKDAETRKDAAKAEILMIIGESKTVVGTGFKISAGSVKESLGTLIEPSMIGTRVGGRKGYRGMRVYPQK